MNSKVDSYLSKSQWRQEMTELRAILLDSQLVEELKWGFPCYTFRDSNVVGINGLKGYCALGFFKGSLLMDTHKILISPGENSQAMRQIRFTNLSEIVEKRAVLKAYVLAAIEVELAGLKVPFNNNTELKFPQELQTKLDECPALKTTFHALTPGRQRAYVLHFSAPKQSKTRESRVEKCMQRILSGKGLTDCTCGHSKKPPQCDGSHKYFQSAVH